MQLCTAVGATPRYALLADDNLPLGPLCVATDGETCTAIYGFTNREAYDRFRGDRPESMETLPAGQPPPQTNAHPTWAATRGA